jgi:hypothetical protein
VVLIAEHEGSSVQEDAWDGRGVYIWSLGLSRPQFQRMATKSELIARLEELLQRPDVEQTADAVEGVKELYESLVAAAQQQVAAVPEPVEAHEGDAPPPAEVPDPGPLPIESAPLTDEDDKRFKQLLDTFNTKVNDIRRKRQKEEADNLAAKQAIMEEMKAMIASEENIGTAFNRFNELGEKWKTIGPIPQQSYRDLQRDFSHLRDEFFYHIRIYKELRDHDLKKNTALKQALIADMESVQKVESVREAEALVKEYQEKWHQIGPVAREEWESVRDGFWNATRVVYDRINEYYKARRAEHEANLQAKQALLDKVNEINATEGDLSAKDWKQLTDRILELQTAWKGVGFATKKDNERIWKDFRNACNAFFERKNVFFTTLKDQFKGVREKKEALIAEAVVLKDSTDWRNTAEKLKQLQSRWKEAGSAGPRDENRLWGRFREACDGFFHARKAAFDKLDAEQAVHVQAKEDLLKEIEGFSLTGDRNADIEVLKGFSQRWLNSGRVSPKLYDAFSTRYRNALDKQYGQLKLNDDERRRMQFSNRVEDIRSAPDGQFQLEKEGRFIKRKIEEVENEMRQMERNMGMFNFKSASGEAMKKEMEKKIERAKEDIERLKKQHRQLMQEMRGPAPVKDTGGEAANTAG